MTVYIAIALALLLLALLEVGAEKRLWARVSLLIVGAFAALRFETGFDWMVYEEAFDETPTIAGALRGELLEVDLAMEPLYVLLNIVVKTFTDNLVVVFAVVAIFAIPTIHRVTGRISRSQCLVWLVYFCLVFLGVQMSSMRSAIASSAVLIGLLLAARQRPIAGLGAIALATGFHSATAIFLPLPFLRNWRPNNGFIFVMVAAGLAAALTGIQLTDRLIDLLSSYLPSLASEKLMRFYRGLEPAQISTGALVLILGQFILLFVFCRPTSEKDRQDPFIIIAIWLTIMMLSAHLLFAGFPAIWNRIMYVALPWQIASLCRTSAFVRLGVGAKRLIVAGLGSMSIAGLIYFLVTPASLPFIPYQSVIQVWLSGEWGDGRERSNEWYAIFGNPALEQRPWERAQGRPDNQFDAIK